jgi:hypothetical protein
VGIGGTVTPQDSLNKLDVSGNVYVLGNIGLNITPGDRTLDVNGNFRASDGLSNVLDFSNGVTSSTDGFRSINGKTTVPLSGTVNIGTLRVGIIHISAQNALGGSNDYAALSVYASDPTGSTAPNTMSSNIAQGRFSIGFSTSNIRISNNAAAMDASWSITYFPTA